ncbi:MAG TPA: GNAT family N-acetyltransferase [Terriglobales bacterium]
MLPPYTTRLATPGDAPAIAEMRRQMFLDMGKPDDERMQKLVATFVPWVAKRIVNGTYMGWIVEGSDGAIVGGAGLLLVDWPPHFRDPNTTRGYILNVWTHPDHRRKGIAHDLMQVIMAEACQRGIRVLTLHASDEGKAVYEKLGFRQSREMMFVQPE